MGLPLLFLCILSAIAVAPAASWPQQGCQKTAPPGPDHFENTLLGQSITTLPNSTLVQLQSRLDEMVNLIHTDYPPGSMTYPNAWLYFQGRPMLYFRLYKNTRDPKYLDLAKQEIDFALRKTPTQDYKAFGFLKGRNGILAVAAMIAELQHNPSQAAAYVNEIKAFIPFVNTTYTPSNHDGIAGCMAVARLLNDFYVTEMGADHPVIPSSLILHLGRTQFEKGLARYDPSTNALSFEPPYQGVQFIGVGTHGSGGPIIELMRSPETMANETIRKYVQGTVDWYVSQIQPTGSMPSDYPNRVQWCHGSPGFIAIYTVAHRVFGDDKYLQAAKLAARFTAERGILSKGVMVCHGASGSILMLLMLYGHTGDQVVLSQALSMLLVALKTPQLTDPQHWISYDCVAGSSWGSSSFGLALLASEILTHQADLGQASLVAFGSVW